MRDLSVAGARAEWVASGFLLANFDPETGDDTRTVRTQSITDVGGGTCPVGEAFFDAKVSVTFVDLVEPKPTLTCEYVPDLRGMTVSEARTTWLSSPLADAVDPESFVPDSGFDDRVVLGQVTTPASDPGDCLEPTVAMTVSYGPPRPAPPPAPCLVPGFAMTPSAEAVLAWTGAGFVADNLAFDKPNKLPYTIQTQSLVGLTWVGCGSSIELGPGPGGGKP